MLMINTGIDRAIICPGCGQSIVLDKLKKHIKREHGFQEPFSLSQAVYALSNGEITASDLYSESQAKQKGQSVILKPSEIPKIKPRLKKQDKTCCPYCNISLRKNQLENHIITSHQISKLKSPNKPKKLLKNNDTQKVRVSSGKCIVCERPAIPGDNVCYTHSR